MTLSKAHGATIERLASAIDSLTTAIEKQTKQLAADCRVETERIRLLAELFEVKPKRQRARTKAP